MAFEGGGGAKKKKPPKQSGARNTVGGLPYGPGVPRIDPPPVAPPKQTPAATPPAPPPQPPGGPRDDPPAAPPATSGGGPPRPGLISAWVDGTHLWYDAATGNYYDGAGTLVWSPTGGGGDTGAGKTQEETPFVDWGSILSNFGLPKDLIDEVMKAFGSDPNTERAVSQALAYVRGSKWYAETFPGISAGIKKGLFNSATPEKEYRQWLTQVQQTWARYSSMGGALDKTDIESWLAQGFDPGTIERRFQGLAYAQTYGADLRYTTGAFDPEGQLSSEDVQELGRHQAGLTSARGLSLADRVSKAQARMERIFQGVLATPLFEQRGRGIAAASLSPQRGRPDIGA